MKEPAKILLVDDEVELVNSLKDFLEANGYAVVTALDGSAALEVAKNARPDLILLDLMLPKLGGQRVCRLLKSDQDLSHIPIVVLTARSGQEDLAMVMESGADSYLVKPISPQALLNWISVYLPGQNGSA